MSQKSYDLLHYIDMAAHNADLLNDTRTAIEQAAMAYPVDLKSGMGAQQVGTTPQL